MNSIPIKQGERASSGISGDSTRLRDALDCLQSREVVFAVVGYAGSGTTFCAGQIKKLLEKELQGQSVRVNPIKARDLLDQYNEAAGGRKPTGTTIEIVGAYQRIGDQLRQESGEYGAVAAFAVKKIRELRSAPPEVTNIYVIDSIKHPAEVGLLRSVYGDAFCLVGVGCRPDVRKKRLERKYSLEEDSESLLRFVERDAEDSEHKYGQQVNDTFHLSDYFVDNTGDSANEEQYTLADQVKRLFDILFTDTIRRPTAFERGMYHAHAASMRSSCLSRQVGASILDAKNNLLAVGSNEVPKYGGGSYDGSEPQDHRCFAANKYCSNTIEQDRILHSVLKGLKTEGLLRETADDLAVLQVVRKTRIKSLIEFSRSVHAEMDAIISLARSGTKLESGSTLFSTTYPCHSCARHIVAAGLGTVIYLEPYAKSLAIDLHQDSIADNETPKKSEGRVRFKPYEGVAPRLYRRVYQKMIDLKDKDGKLVTGRGEKKSNATLWAKAYTDLEADVAEFVERVSGKKI